MLNLPQDNRIKFVRLMRLGCLGLLALIVLLGIVLNFTRLNGDDIRRTASRIAYGLGGQLDQVEAIAFTEGESRTVVPFKDGIVAVADDRIKVYDSTGLLFMNEQLVMDTPSVAVTARHILIFDRGAKSLAVYDSFNQKEKISFDQPIIDAAISESGALIVAHKTEGYKSQLTVYDNAFRERYKWYASDTYVTATAVYGIPTRFACAGIRLGGEEMTCEVLCFDAEKAEPIARIPVAGSFVYDLRIVDGATAICVTDQGYFVLDMNKQAVKYNGSFGQNTLSCYDISGSSLVFGFSGRTDSGYELLSVDLSNGNKTKHYLPSAAQSVATYGQTVYVMYGECYYRLGHETMLGESRRGEYRIDTAKDGSLLALSTKQARYIK